MQIERPLTGVDGKMVKPNQKTWDMLFMDALHKVEQECTIKHVPFDRTCAIYDFNDKYNQIRTELARSPGGVDENDPRLKIDFGDLQKYADPKRFQTLGEAPDVVNRNIDGQPVPTQIGVSKMYMCNQRGHKFAVQIPNPVRMGYANVVHEFDTRKAEAAPVINAPDPKAPTTQPGDAPVNIPGRDKK